MWDQVTPTATGRGEEDGPHGAGPAGAVCVLGLWLQGRPCGGAAHRLCPQERSPGPRVVPTWGAGECREAAVSTAHMPTHS